ncbi:nuclear transport factor 2 family protein [Candidatus Uabimicrobium sp. HlEnr_7]|uniref:nuclear transport factor 2 family protein n=1 Tax=Candidatus Uabimicrobium helgolandensis TaxID=3095367 RepID=UPI0035575CD9
MKPFFLLAITITILLAQNQSNKQIIEEVISLEKMRYTAMVENNHQFLQEVLNDDLSFTHANGIKETKKAFLQRLKQKDLIYHSIKLKNLQLKLYGNCAVITGISKIHAQGKGLKVQLNLRFITVYSKTDNWQVVAYQSTQLAKQK